MGELLHRPYGTITSATRLPLQFVWVVVGASAFPLFLNMAGFDLGTQPHQFDPEAFRDLSHPRMVDLLHRALAGSFTHTILLSCAICTALFAVILAFAHYYIKRDVTTPIIGMALFCAACMDTFRVLAADRFVETGADKLHLIPFTWTLSRVFNAMILIVGVSLLLMRRRDRREIGVPYAIGVSLSFGFISYALIRYCATSSWLPKTQFSESWISRPYDLIPLTMFLFGYAFVYRPFHRQEQTMFSHALVVGVIPEIAAQLHVVFGSSTMYDKHFNSAHLLKVVAYAVPLGGLILDYVHTYRLQVRQRRELRMHADELLETKKNLELQTLQLTAQGDELRLFMTQLEQSNRELEEFARIASHDLQEPLRKVRAFGDRLKSKFSEDLPEQGRDYVDRMQNATGRMQDLINDLLTFSRVTTKAKPFSRVQLGKIVREVLGDLEVCIEEAHGRVEVGDLPEVDADPLQMRQLFQNLIGNALKYHKPDEPPLVSVQAVLLEDGEHYQITVKDNGIGFDPKHTQKIFSMFQRLHGKDQYEGTGIGLAVCRKISERHGGSIIAESTPGGGAVFTVDLPISHTHEETVLCPA